MKRKKWIFLDENIDMNMVEAYVELFKVTPFVAKAMINRGLTNAADAKRFLDKSMDCFYSPMLLTGMAEAVERIKKAVDGGEKITVYGDYDVDGITSSALLVKYLRSLGASADYYIPDRQVEGYGLNSGALEKIRDRGTNLIITVDAGITANEEAKYAAQLGMDIIITDHHECKDELPEAIAVINPKRNDCEYPFKELAGVGVAFKLICAMSAKSEKELLKLYGDIIMLGTIADVVPLLDENRVIASAGLDKLYNDPNVGLAAVMQTIGSAKKWNSSAVVSYSIAPRLNAAGRMSNASVAVELLLTNDKSEAAALAQELDEDNKNRQTEENIIFREAEEMLSGGDYAGKRVLVLAKRGWHHGIIGVVASRICDKYNKNCILISIEDDMCKSSGRSIENFNLFEALSECSDILEKFGGHAYAAGCSIKEENIAELDRRLNEYAEKASERESEPKIYIDGKVEISELTLTNVMGNSCLAPHGAANKMPTYAIMDAKIAEIRTLSEGKHCRMMLEKGGKRVEVISFGGGHYANEYFRGDIVDVAGDMNINIYNGVSGVQIILADIRPSIYAIENLLPDRNDFVLLYKFLKSGDKRQSYNIDDLVALVSSQAARTFTAQKIINSLEIFDDVKIIKYREQDGQIDIEMLETTPGTKIELDKSPSYRRIKAELTEKLGK